MGGQEKAPAAGVSNPAPAADVGGREAPDLLAELVEAAPRAGAPRQRERAPERVELGGDLQRAPDGPAAVGPQPEQVAKVEQPAEQPAAIGGGIDWRSLALGAVSIALLAVSLGSSAGGGATAAGQSLPRGSYQPPAPQRDPFVEGLLS